MTARSKRGALPLDRALKFALQIADALDRAHRAGVAHRHVKPANVILRRDGVKALDFGLAKPISNAGSEEATLSTQLTKEGTVLGTPQYMAPEQFDNKDADALSDAWAFGTLLYEMLTGEKAFQGKLHSTLVHAILSADPPPVVVKPFTPAWLERLLRRCLAKDPEDRYQSMRDVVLNLTAQHQETSVAPVRMSHWPWAMAVVCLAAAAVAWSAWPRTAISPGFPVKLDVAPPAGSKFTTIGSTGGSAISPDGRTLAFLAKTAKGETPLHVRPMDSLEARALPGTENAGRPFWSPDSKSLAFAAGGRLKRIDLAGGVPTILCNAAAARGGTWSEEGVILFADTVPGLQRIPASGGTPSPVTQVNREAGETHHYYPQFLPGGKKFLYRVRHNETEKRGIVIGSLDSKPGTPAVWVMQAQYMAVYDAGSGRLLYMPRSGTPMARRLELDPPRMVGDPATVAERVNTAASIGYVEISVSENGTLFYGQGRASGKVFEKPCLETAAHTAR